MLPSLVLLRPSIFQSQYRLLGCSMAGRQRFQKVDRRYCILSWESRLLTHSKSGKKCQTLHKARHAFFALGSIGAFRGWGGGEPGRLWSRADTDDTLGVHHIRYVRTYQQRGHWPRHQCLHMIKASHMRRKKEGRAWDKASEKPTTITLSACVKGYLNIRICSHPCHSPISPFMFYIPCSWRLVHWLLSTTHILYTTYYIPRGQQWYFELRTFPANVYKQLV